MMKNVKDEKKLNIEDFEFYLSVSIWFTNSFIPLGAFHKKRPHFSVWCVLKTANSHDFFTTWGSTSNQFRFYGLSKAIFSISGEFRGLKTSFCLYKQDQKF